MIHLREDTLLYICTVRGLLHVLKSQLKHGVRAITDLVEPEFRGLWEEEGGNDGKMGLDKTDQKLKFPDHIPSKTEQEMMERALVKQKEAIVQKQ